MRSKPDASFGFQPKGTLAATDSPSFHDHEKHLNKPASPLQASSQQAPPPFKSRNELAQSFCDLIRSPTAVPPPPSTMSRSRSASFSDDDLMIVSSQAMSSQGYGSQDYPSQELGGDLMSSPLRPIQAPNDVIDITSSPVAPALTASKGSSSTAPTTRQPMFGRPTQMSTPTSSSSKPAMSSSAAAAAALVQRRQNALFNTNQKRPEHHRPQRLTGPLAPKQPDRKAAPRPVFSSMGSTQGNGGTAYPVSSFYSNTTTNKTIIKQSIPASTHADVDFYTDPDKATADLKALLEGGMEDDEDDDEEAPAPAAAQPTKEGAVDTAVVPAEELAKKKDKQEPEGYDDGTVEGIKVKLLPHQVEGVKWMRGRELGPVKRGRVPKGGILADDMGLGKTLQSISLILTNPKPTKEMPGWKKHYEKITGGTLVVAPLALIRQWEAEIKEKVSRDPPLSVCVHHGPQRTVRPQDLAKFDVVITTYQILVSEQGHSNNALRSGCFGLQWFRLILDEAHSIKNRNAKMTKACCALPAEFRWCLTGTPMQNNLDELQSLVNFLRITPYDNLAEWRAHIDAPLKNGRGYLAIRRLHSLLRCFMKRRTKDVLKEEGALVPGGKKAIEAAAAAAAAEEKAIQDGTQTPGTSGTSTPASGAANVSATPSFKITERNVVSVSAEFSPSEREFYDRLEERADKSLEKMMQGKSMSYANALVLLLRLRQACNHPSLLNLKLEKDKDAMTTDAMPASQKSAATDNEIDALADVFGGLGIQAKKCEVCMTDLTKEEQRECEAAGDGMVCTNCIEDREILEGSPKKVEKEKKSKKHRKDKKSKKAKSQKHKVKKEAASADEDEDDSILPASRIAAQRKPRNRRAIIDSDDEEEDDGSWLVGEEERGSLRLGKAGGEEDENAEGGGDWINGDDSIHKSEDEDDDASRLSSFIEDDEKEATAANKSQKKHAKKILRIGGQDWDSDESDDEDFVSFAQSAGSATDSDDDSSSDSESDSSSDESSDGDSEEDSRISTSELMSNVDDDSFIGRRSVAQRKKKSAFGSSSDSDTVLVSAKIRKMLSILKKEAGEHKFIVFSQFTSMLNLVSPFLMRAGLGHVRYEGSMRNDAREASLHSLRHDPNVRVLLCSLKCGALGLNLTAATRVIILEPFWNPFVEEQAIDRVHRLTQTIDVTVYKLTVSDTVEQRILALQDKKRLLAAQALEAGTAGGRGKKEALKLGLKELMDLFKHDARGPPGVGAGSDDVGQDGVNAAFVDQFAAMGSGLLRRRDGGGIGSRGGGASQESVYGRRW